MNVRPYLVLAAALVGGAMLVTSAPLAQNVVKGKSAAAAPKATGSEKPTFAAPVMLKAGDKNLGEKRLYPSPVIQDMNGDGLADIVVGDLFGYLTVAHRMPGQGPAKFGEEAKVKDHAGKDIKFNNW